jgi:hypothetical protein
MIERRSGSGALKLGLRIFGLIACLGLGWLIVANTMADTQARTDPETALAWRSATPAAMVALAEESLVGGENGSADPDAAERLAERTLYVNPLEERAWRALGLAAALRGDEERAATMMELAGARSRRDAPVQIWLFNRNLARENYEAALANADALLRSRPDLSSELAPFLVWFANEPETRRFLIGHLVTDPPWRSWFLGELSDRMGEPAIVFDVYSALLQEGHPATDAELLPFLRRLLAKEQFELAHLVWLRFLDDEERSDLRYAYNGDFEAPITGLPFDWSISQIRGATAGVVDLSPERDHVLRVEFANSRIPFDHVAKLMPLPQGRYRLTGEEKATDLQNERGMVWRVSCAEGEKAILAETELLAGTTPWRDFAVEFAVPPSGCRAQWLRLVLAARTALEQQVGGEVFYDNVRIERVIPTQQEEAATFVR